MRTKLKIILIVLLIPMLYPAIADAAVPVTVFGEYLYDVYNIHDVWDIHENTKLELSLETFMYDLFKTLTKRQEEFVKTFELAKIEKAREDVNKLMFETQRELTGQGVITKIQDPITGQDYTIKKEGRIITNPDDFLYEEPLQKARDFVYCYLAPWKHFAWGDDTKYCNAIGTATIGGTEYSGPIADGSYECTSQNVCLLMPQYPVAAGNVEISRCPSDTIRDSIKQRLLNELIRKEQNWKIAPPESWYTPAICEKVLSSSSCVNTENCFTGCNLIDGSCDVENVSSLSTEDKAKIYDTHTTLTQSVAYNNQATIYDYQQTISNPNNNPNSLEKILRQKINAIIEEYQQLRQVQYIAGQGIRPEKYLIGITDVKEGTSDQKCGNRYFDFANGLHTLDSYCKENDILYFGRSLNMNYNKDNNAYSNKTFWFDTENITSPAIILLQKMAAAAQAQFNLAQQAYKYPADNSTTSTSTIRNTSGDCDNNKEFCEEITFDKPTINELPAPWEDDNDYAKLPQEYIDDWTGTHPDDIGDIYGAGYYLNSWYKDITQMYLQKDEEDTFIRTLKNWFCIEDDKGLDTSCFNQRDPKYYEP